MRIVSYNILDGGEGRADPLAEVLLAQRPDVVALLEADNQAVVERLAKRLEMDYVIAEGDSHAVALLSRLTIVNSVDYAIVPQGKGRGCLAATVRAGQHDLPISVVHPHSRQTVAHQKDSLHQINAILDVSAQDRREGRPHLLVGNFSAVDVRQASQTGAPQDGHILPDDKLGRIAEAGYLDTLRIVHPRKAAKMATFSTADPAQRPDYIFAYGVKSEQIREAWIECDRLAKYASDHFPIGAEIAL